MARRAIWLGNGAWNRLDAPSAVQLDPAFAAQLEADAINKYQAY
jgi:hypothetical protein